MRFWLPRSVWRFLYLWLMVGFASGTAVLLGPAKWVTDALRGSRWSEREDQVMLLVILLYVAGSFWLSMWLSRRLRRGNRRSRRLVFSGATLLAGLSLWGWMHPALFARAAGGPAGHVWLRGGPEFVFGPYPDGSRLARLKADGITAVVSLQHPAVVPFEPPGIAAERTAAAAVGMPFIHAPMLPWVSANEASLETIRKLAQGGEGRYYVHCGLGRDRTNVVKRMLERMGTEVATTADFPAARTFAKRLADRGPNMERGHFQELEKDVWLIPYPNQHELYGNMLAGQVAHVLLLLDPDEPEQRAWLDHVRQIFAAHAVPFSHQPVRAGDSQAAREAAGAARRLPRPLTVVAPYTRPREKAEAADAFLEAYHGLGRGD